MVWSYVFLKAACSLAVLLETLSEGSQRGFPKNRYPRISPRVSSLNQRPNLSESSEAVRSLCHYNYEGGRPAK